MHHGEFPVHNICHTIVKADPYPTTYNSETTKAPQLTASTLINQQEAICSQSMTPDASPESKRQSLHLTEPVASIETQSAKYSVVERRLAITREKILIGRYANVLGFLLL